MKVVFDTNIIVSGLYSKRGASFQLLRAALAGELSFAISPLLAFEYEGVLEKKIKDGFLKISSKDCKKILSTLYPMATIVWMPIQIRPVLFDPADDKILECAISGNCSHILTFNKKHFPIEKTAPWNVDVMSAGEFLQHWRNKS